MTLYPNYPCIHNYKVEFTSGWQRSHPIEFDRMGYGISKMRFDAYIIFWWTSLFETCVVRV